MKRLRSVPISQNVENFDLPQGSYGSIMLEYDVTTASGQTGTRALAGTVEVEWNGETVIKTDVEALNLLNNVYGGIPEATFAAAGNNRMIVVLPLGLWTDPSNIWYIEKGDVVTVKLDFTNLASISTAGNVKIYGKSQIGVQGYLHKFITRKITAGAAGNIPDTYRINNISQVYLKDPATSNVTDVFLQKNGETLVQASVVSLKAYSAYIHLLETAVTMIAIDLGESRDVRENVGSDLNYEYTFSGAGTLNQYFSYISFTPDKEASSRAYAQMKLKSNIQRALS